MPTFRPVVQHLVQTFKRRDLGHERATTLLGRLDRVGLQPVLPNTFRIGKIRLHRQDPRRTHLGGFLDDEIGSCLLDRGKKQPQIRRIALRCTLFNTGQNAATLTLLDHLGPPFPILAVEKQHCISMAKAHHAEKVMRLRPVQRNGLPLAQGVLYIQSNLCRFHGPDNMTAPENTPEPNHKVGDAVADAVKDNWVDRIAPVATRPYLRLSRADRPIGTWLLLLPCWWGLLLAMLHDGQARWFDLWIFFACGLGAWLMRGAGCTWNDITDRDIDGSVERTRSRPIPSGQVSVKMALAWMVAQALVAFVILLTFPVNAILLGILALLPVAIYPFAKRFTWWPQIFLGLAFNWGALLAWTAHTGTLGTPAIILYFAGISWTLFYDTIYAHQDKEDDALIGVKSTARLFGTQTPIWLRRFLIGTVTLMGLAIIAAMIGQRGNPLALLIALSGACVMGWHMVWQIRMLDIDDNDRLLMLFRSNRDTGLIPLPFFAVALFL